MSYNPRYWGKCLASITVGLVISALVSSLASAANPNPTVLPIGSRPYGQTYGQWSARWWQYAVQQPNADICAADKVESRVTFLGGTPITPGATRSCTVRSGQAIMFPVFNVEWSVAEATTSPSNLPGSTCPLPDLGGNLITGTNYSALLACATAQAQHGTDRDAMLAADVDGVSLQGLTSYRAVSPPPPFPLTVVPGNPYFIPAGQTSAAADGFWIILTPLSPGTHTIHFAVTIPFFGFFVDQTYDLTVQP
jgi:hypothetical protein